jgi:hypothetical protein
MMDRVEKIVILFVNFCESLKMYVNLRDLENPAYFLQLILNLVYLKNNLGHLSMT